MNNQALELLYQPGCWNVLAERSWTGRLTDVLWCNASSQPAKLAVFLAGLPCALYSCVLLAGYVLLGGHSRPDASLSSGDSGQCPAVWPMMALLAPIPTAQRALRHLRQLLNFRRGAADERRAGSLHMRRP